MSGTITDQIYSAAPDKALAGTPEILFNYDSRNITANAGSSYVTGCLNASIGQIPSGYIPIYTHTDGSAISGLVMQYDNIVTASDGSMVGCAFAALLPENLGAANGSTKTKSYQWAVVAGTPNTTPVVTLAQIMANSDYKAKFHGGSLEGASTVSLNDILTNFSAGPDWGANPLGGYTVQYGPAGTRINAWRFLKQDSDGTSHRWLRARFEMFFFAAGGSGVSAYGTVRAEHPNILGPVTGGTNGPSTVPNFYTCIAELWNGSSQVITSEFAGAIGGSLDSLTFSVPSGSFAVANNGISVATSLNSFYAYQVTSTGTVPSGFTSGGIYFPITTSTSGQTGITYFFNNRNDAVDAYFGVSWTSNTGKSPGDVTYANNQFWRCSVGGTTASSGSGPSGSGTVTDGSVTWVSFLVPITTTGSGTVTFTGMACIAHGCGFFMTTTDAEAEPIWLGTGSYATRPAKVMRIMDFDHIRLGAKGLSWPYDPQWSCSPPPTDVTYLWRANAMANIPWDVNTTGDSSNDPRIGKDGVVAAVFIYLCNVLDYANITLFARTLRRQAFGWADYQSRYIDETRGRRTCGTNTNYTGLGVARPNMDYLGNGGFIGKRSNGYVFRYGQFVDGSHLPMHAKFAYRQFGYDAFLGEMVDQIGSLAMQSARNVTSSSGTVYYSPWTGENQQVRGAGWFGHAMLAARYHCPDSDPETAHYRECMSNAAGYYLDRAQNNNAAMKAIGYVIPLDIGLTAYGVANTQIWMHHYFNSALMCWIWSGFDSRFRTAVVTYGGYKWMTNLYLPEFGGQMVLCGTAELNWNTSQTIDSAIGSIAGVWAGSPSVPAIDQWGYPGQACQSEFSSPCWIGSAGPLGKDVTDFPSLAALTFEMCDIVGGIPNARPARERYRARVARYGGMNLNKYPTFSARSNAP